VAVNGLSTVLTTLATSPATAVAGVVCAGGTPAVAGAVTSIEASAVGVVGAGVVDRFAVAGALSETAVPTTFALIRVACTALLGVSVGPEFSAAVDELECVPAALL
jgi:hypothetical protein